MKILEKKLRAAADAYYNGDPVMSDAEYDRLQEKLRQLDPKNPVLQEVGAAPVGRKVRLPWPMFSLDKIKKDTADRWLGEGPYEISDKLDGFSLQLVYDGPTLKIYTRGNGTHGKDISYLAPHLKIPAPRKGLKMAVRAEGILPKAAWDSFEGKFVNERSLMSNVFNSLRGKVSEATGSVRVVAYEIMDQTERLKPSAQKARLKQLGFDVAASIVVSDLSASRLSAMYATRKAKSRYHIDGLVVQRDRPYKRAATGNPVYAAAFKENLEDESTEAKVINIAWEPSAHGIWKPVVEIEPTKAGGVTIRRITGNHARYIEENGLGPGAVVQITRSGGVIPQILKVIKKTGSWQAPPGIWYWDKTRTNAVAELEGGNADLVAIKRLVRFFATLGAEGLKAGVITKLYSAGFHNVPAILKLTVPQLLKVPGFQRQAATKLLSTIDSLKQGVDLAALVDASAVFGQGFGTRKAQLLTRHLPGWLQDWEELTPKQIQGQAAQIPGMGQATSAQLAKGYRAFRQFVTRLERAGVTVVTPSAGKKKGRLTGFSFLFTGYRDKALMMKAQGLGATEATTVKQATHLVAKDRNSGSSKLKQAEAAGIPIITPQEFERIVNEQ